MANVQVHVAASRPYSHSARKKTFLGSSCTSQYQLREELIKADKTAQEVKPRKTLVKLLPFFIAFFTYFYIYGAGAGPLLVYGCIKCLPIISLIAFVLSNGLTLEENGRYGRCILFGLFTSLLGDIFMVFKARAFFAFIGILHFITAHIFYIAAFGFWPLKLKSAIGFVILGVSVFVYLLDFLPGITKGVIFIYVMVICVMMWRATVRVDAFCETLRWSRLWGCFGAGLFLVTDLILFVHRFVLPLPKIGYIIMIPYYLSQMGISISVVGSQVDETLKINVRPPFKLSRFLRS